MRKFNKTIIHTILLLDLILLVIVGGTSGLLFLLQNLTELDPVTPSIIMGGLVLIAIIATVIFVIFRLDMASAKKVMRQYGLTEEEVEADLNSGYQNANTAFGKRFFACTPGTAIQLGMVKDVIWVYYHTIMFTEHYGPYGLFKSKKANHFLVIMMRDGKSYQMTVESVAKAEDLLDWLRLNHPHILRGLTEERRNLFQRDFQRLVEMSDEMGSENKKPSNYYNEISLEEVKEQSQTSSSGFKLSVD